MNASIAIRVLPTVDSKEEMIRIPKTAKHREVTEE